MCERQGLSPEWLAELDRRMAEHEADPSSALEWDDAMKVIFADPAE
jgi:putative addiction module component (TIGR02574 family)